MLSHTHTCIKSPMRSVSCRSRPDCPFRCNLICTPIILCFSGDCVSRAPSQHVDLLSPFICHCLSNSYILTLFCLRPSCVRALRESASRMHTSSICLCITSSPLSLVLVDVSSHQGLCLVALSFCLSGIV